MGVGGSTGALDIGTSSVRALLFDTGARPVPGIEVHLPYEPRVDADGTYETDASRLFSLVGSAVDGLLHEAGPRRRRRIRAMGVSTFWHGLLAADEKAHPLTPLYLWADTRSWRQSDRLRRRVDAEAVHQRTGCLIHPTYWPAKLLWLKAGQPDLWRRRPRLLSFWDLVHHRLFGNPVTGVSMASGTGLLELAGIRWDAPLQRLKPAASGLTFLPLLAGERSPGFASHATGSIAGLTQATTAVDIVRAGLEATAIEFARVDRSLDAVLPGARRLIANGAGLLASPA